MKNRHKYRVLRYCQENQYCADILLQNQVAFTATIHFLSAIRVKSHRIGDLMSGHGNMGHTILQC